jgi:hypothetical protein
VRTPLGTRLGTAATALLAMTEERERGDVALTGESAPLVCEARPAAGLVERLMDEAG